MENILELWTLDKFVKVVFVIRDHKEQEERNSESFTHFY